MLRREQEKYGDIENHGEMVKHWWDCEEIDKSRFPLFTSAVLFVTQATKSDKK